ncbi:MAG: tail completion protein gp17 [Nitrosomonadaceae bacterium]
MALSQAIAAVLEANSDLLAAMGTRIYPDVLPFKYTLPAVTFNVNNITITETKDSTDTWDEADLRVTVHATNRADAETYMGYVRTAITRVDGTYGGLDFHTGNHRGENWDYAEENTQAGTTGMAQGVFLQSMDIRLAWK